MAPLSSEATFLQGHARTSPRFLRVVPPPAHSLDDIFHRQVLYHKSCRKNRRPKSFFGRDSKPLNRFARCGSYRGRRPICSHPALSRLRRSPSARGIPTRSLRASHRQAAVTSCDSRPRPRRAVGSCVPRDRMVGIPRAKRVREADALAGVRVALNAPRRGQSPPISGRCKSSTMSLSAH